MTTTHYIIFNQERWRGVLHHVCNLHHWYGGECEHDTLPEPPTVNGVQVDYFVRGDAHYVLLQKLLMDKTWMKSLKYFTQFRCNNLLICVQCLINSVNIKLYAFSQPQVIITAASVT